MFFLFFCSSNGLVESSSRLSGLFGFNEQTNQSQRSISSRLTSSTLNSKQTSSSLTNQAQFSTLQSNQQYKNLRNSFNVNKPINISLNELQDRDKVNLPTRVNCEQLINEIIETNLNENDQSVNENDVGLQLFVAKDGTAKLGSRSNTKSKPRSSLRMVKSSNEVGSFLNSSKQNLPFQKLSK